MTITQEPISGRRCVVLGAGGFIGTNLCRRLSEAGALVTGFGRRPHAVNATFAQCWVDGEFDDERAVARALADAEIVFHLLGGSDPATSNRDPATALQRALASNLMLIAAATKAGVRKLVFVSSGGTVYGPPAQLPITEGALTDPISAYGLDKLLMEKLLGLYRLIDGLDYVILRVSNPYGPFQRPNRAQGIVATILKRALDNEPVEIWGDGSVIRDYLYVDDVCDALIAASVTSSESRLFNIGSGIGRSLNDVVSSISHVIGVDIQVNYRSARAADIPINILQCDRARDSLNWKPRVEWQDGIRASAVWIAENP